MISSRDHHLCNNNIDDQRTYKLHTNITKNVTQQSCIKILYHYANIFFFEASKYDQNSVRKT